MQSAWDSVHRRGLNFLTTKNCPNGGNIGFLYFGEKDNFTATMTGIPIEGIVNYKIGTNGLYAGGFLGLTFWSTEVEMMGRSSSTTETRISLGPAIGYRMALNDKMQLDASARYSFGASDGQYIGLRVGIAYGM